VRAVARHVLSREEAVVFAESERTRGGVVVFTNGVFDLLHPGHVRYLAEAKAMGTVLLVGLNSDRSVRTIKGPSRPVTPELERAEILLALGAVDAVTVFDEETPQALITAVRPDVLVKGADWSRDAIVGREFVESHGGRVAQITFSPGHSTSTIIERVRASRVPGSL
jgi:D-glycero-beta-D-manno-heptose 1-phosphate adenylyltransferase